MLRGSSSAVRRLAAAALVVFSVSPLWAAGERPPAGAITGAVVDQLTQQPVPGAQVLVEETGAALESGSDGRFALSGVAVGTYRLLVTRPGFAPVRQADVVVNADRETGVRIEIHALPAFAETVEATAAASARPADLPTSLYQMSYEEIRRAPGALGDVSRVIQSLPGAAARDDGRNDIVARGGSPMENLLLVDGFEVPSISHFSAPGTSGGPISMLSTELIGGATFLAGGFPAQYGDRLSSVLEVSLREGSRERFQAEAEVGLSGAGLILEGPLGGGGSWVAGVHQSYLELIAEPFGLTTVPRFSNYQLKAVWDLGGRGQLTLVGLGGKDDISFLAADDPDGPDDIDYDSRSWRTVTGLSWRQYLGARGLATLSVSHSLSAYRNDLWDKSFGGQLISKDRSREGVAAARYDVTYRAPVAGTVRAGLFYRRFDADYEIAHPFGLDNVYEEDPPRTEPLAADESFATHELGGFSQLTRPLGRHLTVTLGGRYDRHRLLDQAVVSPRGALAVHVTPTLDLSASFGRYHQVPPLVLMTAVDTNRTLSTIRADHGVLGLLFSPRPDLRLSVEAYEKRYDGYPVSTEHPFLSLASLGSYYIASDILMPMVSRGSGRARGLEVYVQKHLSQAFYGQVSYAWSQTRHTALDGVSRPSAYDLPHVLSVVGGYRRGRKLEVSTRFSYTSGRPELTLDEEASRRQNHTVFDTTNALLGRGPAYHRLDLRVDRRFHRSWGTLTAFLEADNVYDRANLLLYVWNQAKGEREALHQVRRLILGGLTVQF